MIIGITGTLGSGKETLTQYLMSRGFAHYSSGETLARLLTEKGLPATRENMSPLAQRLADEKEGGVVGYSYDHALTDGAENFILEALHRKEEEDFVRKVGGYIIGIDADLALRYERIHKRQEGEKDHVTFEEFQQDAKNEDEGAGGTSYIRDIMSRADVVIYNNTTIEDLYAEIARAYEKLTLL